MYLLRPRAVHQHCASANALAQEATDQALAKDSERFIRARDALAYIEKAKAMVSEQMGIDFNDAPVSKADMASIFEGLETVNREKKRKAKVNWLPFSRNCKELFGTRKIEKLKKKSKVYLKGFMDRSEGAPSTRAVREGRVPSKGGACGQHTFENGRGGGIAKTSKHA